MDWIFQCLGLIFSAKPTNLAASMRILVLDDCPRIRKVVAVALQNQGYECVLVTTGEEALSVLRKEAFDVLFLDLNLGDGLHGGDLIPRCLEINSRLKVVIITAHSSIASAVEMVKAGAVDYIPKPFTPQMLEQCLEKIGRQRQLEGRIRVLESEIESGNPEASYFSREPRMQDLYELALRAAVTPTTLLILGESGTGKSFLARAIHAHSRQKDGAFITVNCPSLSKELFESDLFGHTRGAFTGAVRDKDGKVTHADGGTLFFDEIGEMPLEIQAKLLRLIQDREYERVGDPRLRKANVRVLAATNKDLEAEVHDGRFREDLFYRLNVVPLVMPPLRERMVDLPHFADKLLHFLAPRMGKQVRSFTPDALHALQRYNWPGNLRELRNAIEHSLIMTRGDEVLLTDLPAYLRDGEQAERQVGALVTLAEIERAHIERILEQCDSQEEAASILGIDPATLYRKRKRFGLDIAGRMAVGR